MESRKRILRACDFCHHRGIKVSGRARPPPHAHGTPAHHGTQCVGRADDGATPCRACQRYNIPCASDRPQKKRGPVPRHRPSWASRSEPEGEPVKSSDETPVSEELDALLCIVLTVFWRQERLDDSFGAWQPLVVVPLEPLLKVLTIYHETAYPIFPFFVWPTFIDKVAREEHLGNRPFYGVVMAAAALALARTRDSATPSRTISHEEAELLPAPEVLFAAAEDAMPKDLTTAEDFDYVRASALLALVGIQFARPRKLQQHLGTYNTLCSVNRSHDERRWGANLTAIEKEERRRVIWSIYTLEVSRSARHPLGHLQLIWLCLLQLFAALSFGGTLRSRQTSIKVQYPLVTDESLISCSGDPSASPASANTTRLTGWNFVTELYKTLEYALDSTQDPSLSSSSSATSILDFLDATYATLPPIFKEMRSFIGDTQYDRFGYQTANIRVTLQTVKMVAVCRDLSEPCRREQAVQIAETLLQDVNAVPLPYLQAISSPLVSRLSPLHRQPGAR